VPAPKYRARPLIVDVNPKSPISEAYRVLRTNIEFSSIDQEIRVLMVTSTQPGEGKTTTSANLAVAYAQAGKRVLVVDCDLRKPTLHLLFNVSNRTGFTNTIVQQLPVADAVKETSIENLSVLTSGPIPPNPSEMLGSERMNELLTELKANYDIIVIDTPPAVAVADAQVVATKVDGVVLVINSGQVKRELAMKVKASLDHVKARIIGVVLNNVDRKEEGSYYYYYYGKAK
jgi:capsular exopolysaccharide synthesis family protein